MCLPASEHTYTSTITTQLTTITKNEQNVKVEVLGTERKKLIVAKSHLFLRIGHGVRWDAHHLAFVTRHVRFVPLMGSVCVSDDGTTRSTHKT